MSLLAYTGLHRRVEERIEGFIEEHRPRFIYVFFSGGKDSSAVLAAAASCCMDRIVVVYNHIVGQTHVLNVEAVMGVARRLGLEIVRVVPRDGEWLRSWFARNPPRPGQLIYIVARTYRYGLDFWSGVEKWGFPVAAERFGRGVRWCCGELKEKWWRRLPANGTYNGRPARYGAVGMKRADSPYRKRTWTSMVRVYKSTSPVNVTLAPLYDLSDEDVFALLRHYGIYDIVYKQYKLMGQSPNCVLCPLMGFDKLKKTLKQLKTPHIQHVYNTLCRIYPRYRDKKYSNRMITRWLEILGEELNNRGIQVKDCTGEK